MDLLSLSDNIIILFALSTDLSELRLCYHDIIKSMPGNYLETVQLLERELCDTHISSLFGCSHFTAANQIILECLMERVNCKADILDLCDKLLQLSNAPQLSRVIENLRKGECSVTESALVFMY